MVSHKFYNNKQSACIFAQSIAWGEGTVLGVQPIETAVPYSSVAAMDFDTIFTHMSNSAGDPDHVAFELTGNQWRIKDFP